MLYYIIGIKEFSVNLPSTNYLYNAATQERETTLNQLLIELNGFDTGKGVIFLGATNRMDLLDPVLLCPGRFDRKIRIRPPGAKERMDILKVHSSKVKMSPSVDLATYAQICLLAQLLQEAALVAVRNKHPSILQSDMDITVDRLTVRPKRVGINLGHQGQCQRATIEIGTAITSHLLKILLANFYHSLSALSQIILYPVIILLLVGTSQISFHRSMTRHTCLSSDHNCCIAFSWNLENPMTIHGEPPSWLKRVKFVGPLLDFEGSLYDDYDLVEPPVNFDLDDQVARRTEELIHDMYSKTVLLLRRHEAALVKTVKVLLDRKEIILNLFLMIILQILLLVSLFELEKEPNELLLPQYILVMK